VADPGAIDSQLHVIRGTVRGGRRAGDGRGRADVVAMMAREQVTRALLVPSLISGFDNRLALDWARAVPDRFSVVGLFDPTVPKASVRLRPRRRPAALVGIRFVLTHPPADRWVDRGLLGGALDWVWPAAGEAGLPIAVFGPHLLREIGAVAAGNPGTRIVIDHAGATAQKGSDQFNALPRLVALADHPNVFVKLSGLAAYSDGPSPFVDIDPIVRSVVDAFGPGRCMWGSDYTRLQDRLTYGEVVDQVRRGCTFLDAAARADILSGTAARVYGLPQPAVRVTAT
jgi:predicted TIM-barrel fold metal-dependent hydrolase